MLEFKIFTGKLHGSAFFYAPLLIGAVEAVPAGPHMESGAVIAVGVIETDQVAVLVEDRVPADEAGAAADMVACAGTFFKGIDAAGVSGQVLVGTDLTVKVRADVLTGVRGISGGLRILLELIVHVPETADGVVVIAVHQHREVIDGDGNVFFDGAEAGCIAVTGGSRVVTDVLAFHREQIQYLLGSVGGQRIGSCGQKGCDQKYDGEGKDDKSVSVHRSFSFKLRFLSNVPV